MYTKLEKKNDSYSDVVYFYLTSPENSPGFYGFRWLDGKQLQLSMGKNTHVKYNVQTQMKKYTGCPRWNCPILDRYCGIFSLMS